jgi:pilus assembly protein CpaF
MHSENPYGDLGPLEPLLADEFVTEIMINGSQNVYIERRGKLEQVPSGFTDEMHLMEVINRIVQSTGRRIDESHPICDVRFPDGSRMLVIIPPISLTGTTVTIRKMIKNPITLEKILEYGSLSQDMATFLRACVEARINIAVGGGTGSGKTSILNILSNLINDEERIVLLQHDFELAVNKPHKVVLETRPPNIEGKGEVSMKDLIISAMKMRPERIIMSEAQGGEVLHLLQAMNTGHDGAMFTLHANGPRDALARLEIMATMAGVDLPLLMLREQMGSAIQLILNQQRLRDGTRKIMSITEVVGMRGSELALQNLFEFVETGTEDGKITGYFTATGVIPTFAKRLYDFGINLPRDLFMPQYHTGAPFPPHPIPPIPPLPPEPPLPPTPPHYKPPTV